jgi:hypothetical protein
VLHELGIPKYSELPVDLCTLYLFDKMYLKMTLVRTCVSIYGNGRVIMESLLYSYTCISGLVVLPGLRFGSYVRMFVKCHICAVLVMKF